jgi:uncharacterized protein
VYLTDIALRVGRTRSARLAPGTDRDLPVPPGIPQPPTRLAAARGSLQVGAQRWAQRPVHARPMDSRKADERQLSLTSSMIRGMDDSEPAAGAVISAYLKAAQAGDWDTASRFFAEDVALRIPGRSQFAGEHHGRAEAMAYIDAARALTHSGDVTVELVDRLESRERVALIVRERFRREDRDVEIRRANVYRVAGGKIVEVWIFEADQYEVDELFAS